MKDKIQINNIIFKEDEFLLVVNNNVELKNMKATGKMLVDSDGISFIYIAEKEENYIYIVLDEKIWKDIKRANELNMQIFVVNESEKLLLSNFHEELQYLIDNIKGNSNYGEEMVTKVESIFITK